MTKPTSATRRRLLRSSVAAALTAAPGRLAFGASANPDVLVIGAGLAGLNAALNLEDAGFKVQIIEGDDRIGGRLFTAPESLVPGHPEVGGSGIGPHYSRILYAAKRFDVELGPSRARTVAPRDELLYHVRGQAILPDEWPSHSLNPFVDDEQRAMPLHVAQFSLYGGESNPLPRGDLDAWQDPRYANKDVSVSAFLQERGLNPTAIKLGFGTNMSYGANPHDLSVLMGFQSANMIRSLYEGENAFSGGAMAALGGNQRIPEAMARGLSADVIKQQLVRRIDSGKSHVVVTCQNGRRYQAPFCICTLPFSALRHVHIEPMIGGAFAEAVDELDYTPVFQVHMVPLSPYWEKDGLPPSMWTDRLPGRFMALKNDPSHPQRVTSLLSFVNGDMALYLDKLPPAVAAKRVVEAINEIRPSTAGQLQVTMTYSWNRSPLAGGAYAYWRPGQISRLARFVRAPHERVHFAGEHTAVINRGMEGAMESGERAALEVLQKLT